MYNEIVNSLDSISQFASSTGLERGRQLLHDMNNPEKSLKIIHVAGTNGKGSVCAYIAEFYGIMVIRQDFLHLLILMI